MAAIALLALMPSAVGCGGGERRSRSAAQGGGAASETDGSSPDRVTAPQPGSADGGGTPSHPGSPDTEPTAPEPSAAKPNRPDDVAKWGGADFKSAKIERDPKLSDAVAHLDQEKFHGKDEVAGWLLQLLTIDEPPEGSVAATGGEDPYEEPGGRGGRGYDGRGAVGPGPGARGYGGRGAEYGYGERGEFGGGLPGDTSNMVQIEPVLAREVIAILGRNNSQTARKGLHMLLTGAVRTPLSPQELTAETLYAMSDNPHADHDNVFFALATNPGKIVLPPQGDTGSYGSDNAESVRRQVLELIDATGTIDLRHRLAVYLNDPEITEEWASPIEQILITEDQRNLAAQIVLYRSKFTSESIASQLQQRLLEGSRAALGHLMGIEDVGDVSSFSRPGRGRSGGDRGYGPGYGPEGYGPGRGRDPYGPGRGRGVGPRGPGRGYDRDERGYMSSGADPFGLGTAGIFQQRGVRPGGDEPGRRGREGRPSGGPSFGRPALRGRSGDEPALDPKQVYGRLTQLLWTDEVTKQLGTELLDADSLNLASEKLQLLATIPAPSGRQMIAQLFDEYEDEPNVFSSAGMFGEKLADPSFLVVAKSAYHDEKRRRSARPRTSGLRGPRGRGGGRGPVPMGGENELDSNEWVRHVGDYVVALCERLEKAKSTWSDDSADSDVSRKVEAAADNDADSADLADDEPLSGPMAAMGIRLHKGAEIAAEYHLRWPQDVEPRLPGANVAPLEIHYVRMEQLARPSRLVSAYRRAAGAAAITHDEDDGVWYDGLMTDRKTGAKRSVDIRLFNEDMGDSALKNSDERDMIIDILVVEIPGDEAQAPGDDTEPEEETGGPAADAEGETPDS